MKFFKKIKCEKCNESFSKQEQLMHHLQIVHYKNTLYDCKKCNKFFSNMQDMRTHIQKHHSYKKESF